MDDQPNVTRRKRSRFRSLHSFTIRTLLVAVTMTGLWLGYYASWQRQRQHVLRQFAKTANWGYAYPPEDLPYGLQLLREAQDSQLTLPETVDDEELARLQRLFPELRLTRRNTFP